MVYCQRYARGYYILCCILPPLRASCFKLHKPYDKEWQLLKRISVPSLIAFVSLSCEQTALLGKAYPYHLVRNGRISDGRMSGWSDLPVHYLRNCGPYSAEDIVKASHEGSSWKTKQRDKGIPKSSRWVQSAHHETVSIEKIISNAVSTRLKNIILLAGKIWRTLNLWRFGCPLYADAKNVVTD